MKENIQSLSKRPPLSWEHYKKEMEKKGQKAQAEIDRRIKKYNSRIRKHTNAGKITPKKENPI